MSKKIEGLLEKVSLQEKGFYEGIISLHTWGQLRIAARRTGEFMVYRKDVWSPSLHYGGEGFRVDNGKIIGQAQCMDWEFNYETCTASDGKLYSHGKALLEHFPGVTIQEIEKNIEEKIKGLLGETK